MEKNPRFNRRRLLTGATAMAALGVAAGGVAIPGAAHAAGDGHGLRIVDRNENGGRLQYYRFATNEIGWDPGVNVLLPDGYHTSGKRYPVLYLFHGGAGDFRDFHLHHDIVGLTAGRDIIVVMPDGATGWHCNPVTNNNGPRNWETFHMSQLLPWIDANFRTFPEFNGRATAGFSMGGFGAMKYTAKYYGHFCSVSSHSGPTSLRRDFGAVVHWANATSGVVELAGGTVYGVPWNEARVSADNPMERIESYRGKRVFMAVGSSTDWIDWTGTITEWQVREGHREFGAALHHAGIPFESHEVPGTHFFRRDLFVQDLNGMLGRLRRAG
ncbi:MAG TPA: esterase family protein [Candidatus Stackebrandtia excrementipullorum]|nr:esterase family protein [Candidatus Stackebrandtia excrementipullorum]